MPFQSHSSDLSRRDFVKSSAAAVVPIVAGGLLVSPRRAFATKASELRVGLIGCGGRGTGAAFQALNADSNAILYAMGDVFPDRIEKSLQGLTKQLGEHAPLRLQVPTERQFIGFDAYQQVIDSVDVVLLTAPPAFRPAHFTAAIQAGKHVFTEKPMAVDAPGVRATIEAAALAKQKNLSVVSGFCWRYANAERAIFKKINEGAIGDVITVHSTYHASTLAQRPRQEHWSDMEWQLRNWWHFTWLSGDHIVEQACHSVDRLAWGMGDTPPQRCVALGGRAARKGAESGHVFDHFTAIYEFENGKRAFHTCRQIDNCPGDNTDYIYGTEGSAIVSGWIPARQIKDKHNQIVWNYQPTSADKDMYQNEHDALFAAIRSGQAINDGTQMCNSTLMAIMGRMAAYTGQTITWDQALNAQENLTPEKLEMGDLPVAPVAVPGVTKFI